MLLAPIAALLSISDVGTGTGTGTGTFVDVIDTHVHNADVDHLPYTFAASFPDLARNWTINDFAAAAAAPPSPLRVRGALLMSLEMDEAHQNFGTFLQEARWFQATADRCNAAPPPAGCVPIAGIVAGGLLGAPASQLGAYLAELRRTAPAVRGIRQPLWKHNASFFLAPAFAAGARALGAANLTFDLLVRSAQLPDVAKLCAAAPGTLFNLNHLGYPNVSGGGAGSAGFDAWASGLAALAALPNVHAKLSGLPQAFGTTGWTAADFAPFVAEALAVFGPERVNFAGNWFILDEAKWGGTYTAMGAAVLQALALAKVSPRDQARVFVHNAVRLYRLEPL